MLEGRKLSSLFQSHLFEVLSDIFANIFIINLYLLMPNERYSFTYLISIKHLLLKILLKQFN